MERICRLCGVAFTPSPSASGRPRVHCLACRPPKEPKPRVIVEASCEQCGRTFGKSMSTSRFCSESCRKEHRRLSGYRSPGSKSFCTACGAAIHVSRSSAADPMCRQCRRDQVKHGDLAMYEKRGCRCGLCCEAKAMWNRGYRERRAAAGNPLPHGHRKRETRACSQCGSEFTCDKYRPTRHCSSICAGLSRIGVYYGTRRVPPSTEVVYVGPRPVLPAPPVPMTFVKGREWWIGFISGRCAECGELFMAATSTFKERYCSKQCARGRNGRRFVVSPTRRRRLYERDEWTCQLCGDPIDPLLPTSDVWAATLDHIIPQSHMLIPDHSDANLRTAHRWCNSVRGDLTYYTDADLRMVV